MWNTGEITISKEVYHIQCLNWKNAKNIETKEQ